ncbi:PAS domain-containing hybrid sensor histidine kinase/response regulator [Magnetovibrio sp.]|uniref:PAS domain-containing hybrid sensor histidine kinase/response regulator n=1 Tax=Magnetovibrio sp. TaxID=2024836 RepID=UPI002F92DAE2
MGAEQHQDIYQAYNELLQHFEDITRLVSDLIWDVDQDLKLRSVSARLHEITGFFPHEWIGKTLEEIGEFAHPSETAQPIRNWRKPFRDQEFIVTGRNGEKYTFLLSGTPYFHVSSGEFQGVHGVARDITHTLKVEEAQRRSKEAAEKSNQAKTEFLASMSHELRTPLNGILGFAQLLQFDQKAPLNEAQTNYTQLIIDSGNHLLNLIDQVLELAKIESGHYTMDFVDVNVDALIDECLSIIEPVATKRQIKLNKVISGSNNVFVRADALRIKQVILNLLSNAVKYNVEQGSVSVTIGVEGDNKAHIEFSDTGIGIAPEQLEHLFEPFERLGYENSDVQGTGIGLTITRELLHRMDGEIGVISHVGKGSLFWVELPMTSHSVDTSASDVDQDATPGHSVVQGSVGPRTILYIEDNPANLSLMAHVLAMVPDYKLLEAHTAEIGIAVAEKQQPDLILMDINLPGMDGVAAMHALAQMEKTKHIPVVAVSANAMPNDVAQALEAGFHDYLTKPFQIDRLFKVMQDIFAKDNQASSPEVD